MEPTGSNKGVVQISIANESLTTFVFACLLRHDGVLHMDAEGKGRILL